MGDTTMWGVGNLINFNAGYNSIDEDALIAGGYGSLVANLEKSAQLGLAAGEKGYAALTALESGDLMSAKSLGDEASEEAMAASAALTSMVAISAETIDALKASGQHRLGDSLANVKRMVEAIEFNTKFMGAMAGFGKGMAGFGKGDATVAPKPVAPAPAVAPPVRSIQFRQPVPVSSLATNTWVNPIYQNYPVGLAPYY